MRNVQTRDCTPSIHIGDCGVGGSIDRQRTERAVAKRPVDAQQALAVQIALDRAGFSPGEIDGQAGTKTRLALSEFQKSSSLQSSGVVNEETLAALRVSPEPIVNYTITQQDVAGPVYRQDAARHDGSVEAAVARLHVCARGSCGEISQQPGADEEAESWRRVGSRRSDQGAGRRAVRAAVEDRQAGGGCKATAGANPAAGAKPLRQRKDRRCRRDSAGAVEVILSGATKSLVVRDAGGQDA